MDVVGEFAQSSPYLTFWLALAMVCGAVSLATYPLKLVNRWIRHRNIVSKGWPPEHLDGDGDFRSIGK